MQANTEIKVIRIRLDKEHCTFDFIQNVRQNKPEYVS